MIQIERPAAADRAGWEILFAGYNTFYERTLAPDLVERAWDAFQADAEMHALVARIEGAVVGIVHFLTHASTTAADVCYLQDLFTAEAARGKGVAGALIAAVADWARAHRCSRVYWSTQASNETARRLYDRVAVNRGFIIYQIAL